MKLSKFLSIVFLTASFTVAAGALVVMKVGASESVIPDDNAVIKVVEVDPASVPTPGGVGDWVMGFRERLELMLARTEEQKLALEEKFAARREAQMVKIQGWREDHPQKQKLLENLEKRHEAVMERMESRVERISEKRQENTERVVEMKVRFEARKEMVEEGVESNVEWQEKLDAKRREFVESKSNVDLPGGKMGEDNLGRQTDAKILPVKEALKGAERDVVEKKGGESENRVEAAQKDREAMLKKRLEGKTQMTPAQKGDVQGAIDYQPSNWLERIGYMVAGW